MTKEGAVEKVFKLPTKPVSDEQRRKAYGVTEYSEALYNRAAVLRGEGHSAASTTMFRRAISVTPEAGVLWNGLAAAYWEVGLYADAIAAAKHAAELGYADASLHANMGLIYTSLMDYEAAEKSFLKAIALNPSEVKAPWNLSLMYLQSGQWEKGLKGYDSRFNYYGAVTYPKMPFPTWAGEDLSGKTLYVMNEQGVGDRILFSRYLWWVKQTWPTATIKYAPGNSIASLLYAYSPEIEILPDAMVMPDADYGICLMSLPFIHWSRLNSTPPDPGVLLKSLEKVSMTFGELPHPALKVGVIWTGSPAMQRNRERSMPFEMVLDLADNPSVQLYSLQFDNNDVAAYGAGELVIDLVPKVSAKGYVGTAAAMKGLDLVITACTSTAHLAGALGIPCWVLLCENPYWIWGRRGDKSSWYPNVKLYRQTAQGDWGPVFDQVKVDLANLAHEKLSAPQARVAAS
jgi:tetratricopeptide (TPR) repeat protein